MKDYIKAEVQVEGMKELKALIEHQNMLAKELADNAEKIEAIRLEIWIRKQGGGADTTRERQGD